MLRIYLRPWISSPKLDRLLIPAWKVPAHGGHFHQKALSLTSPQFDFSMPPHLKRKTNSSRITKKRRISRSVPRKDKMNGQGGIQQPLPTIELTPLEETLKRLLLDVQEYIGQTNHSECSSIQGDMVLRFTGGWVRDKLLGVLSHDIDVAISTMTGLQFGTYLKEYLDDPDNLAKYRNCDQSVLSDDMLKIHKIEANPERSKHLETVTTRLFGLDIDLVNLRKETYTEESRNPQMEFGTAEEDALRRDATVNAMFYNLNTSMLEDFTGLGIEDMGNKLIRTPLDPYQTFRDDPLRVLRLIRFASRLGYHIDEESQRAMQNDDIKQDLKIKISKERVLAELEKMLQGKSSKYSRQQTILTFIQSGPDPRTALKYIEDLGLYPVIFENMQDDVQANTAFWSLAYDALDGILRLPDGEDQNYLSTKHIRDILCRDKSEQDHAWVVAAFVPWGLVPTRESRSMAEKPPVMARAAEVARDNLRMDNKTIGFVKDAATHFREVSTLKTSVVLNSITGTAAEVRQHVGLQIRSWGKNWRMIVIMALLQDIVAGVEHSQGEFVVFIN
jgi:tRNA nucleotidyltransferase (CCA-adding enzyme)